ncbi:MAG: dTMP kinase [Alphaproteobacteria bacterium]|nr:dTMP kinase [Alphaproteobacteria bacterium]
MAGGRFITFEGGEGAGKSTQIARLAARLGAEGREVVVTREPGGTQGAEAIRSLLVTGATDRWTPLAELLLHYAARADHLDRLIRPALARGAIVLCDRFADSSRAYQGLAQGLGLERVEALDRVVTGRTQPDLTLILDIDPAEGLARAGRSGAGDETRYERMGTPFHDRLRAAFLEIAAGDPVRCRVIPAGGTAEEVEARISAAVRPLLAGTGGRAHGP